MEQHHDPQDGSQHSRHVFLSQPTPSPTIVANGTVLFERYHHSCHLNNIDGQVRIAFVVMAVIIGLLLATLIWSCCCRGGDKKTGKKLKESTMTAVSKFH
jgi:hypothetical protein